MAGAAEGVWRDSKSIHPFAIDCTISGTRVVFSEYGKLAIPVSG